MARYSTPLTSAAALGSGAAFASIVGGANSNGRIRRVILGTIAGTSAVPDQQLMVGINRATARGTATTTLTPGKLDPNQSTSGITGVDTVWSTAPTLASQDLFQIPFNSKAGVDLPFEMLEEMWILNATTSLLTFVNRVNALPAGVSYSLTLEHEE